MYVDEVGNADLRSSDDPNHRFLSLTGVIMELTYVGVSVHPEMEALKAHYFGSHPDDPVIFHRKDLVNRRGSFSNLRDDGVRATFDAELLALLRSWHFTVITVCLDKKAHREKYTTWQYDPYHYCLAALLERFVYFLNRRRAKGDVIGESRGGKEDRRLKESFRRLCARGSDFLEAEQIQGALTTGQLRMKQKSNNLAGLQLADLVAHPSRNEILAENGHAVTIAPFAERIIAILHEKYDRRGDRVFGKKML
jgi:hypothetical protein